MAFRGGGGIRFDNPAQTGTFLDVIAKKKSPQSGAAISLVAAGLAGEGDIPVHVFNDSSDPSTVDVSDHSGGTLLLSGTGTTTLENNGTGPLELYANAGAGVGLGQLLFDMQNNSDGNFTIANNGNGTFTIQNSGGQVVVSANSAGILLEQFGGAAKIQFGPSVPSIDIVASVELLLSGNADVIIEGNGGANGKITLGTGGGGNGGVKIETPANGATPTFDVEVNGGTAKIQAADAAVTLVSENTQLQTEHGAVGVFVQEGGAGPYVPVVEVCDSSTGYLGFFGTAPIVRIPGAGLATVADVVGALQNYGLLG